MRWILFLSMMLPAACNAQNSSATLDFQKKTEEACSNPERPEKQESCINTVKSLILYATSAGYSEAGCYSKIIKDKKLCETSQKLYQDAMKYSMK